MCLNDDIDPKRTEENELVRAILLDFYMSLFPHPSKFELPLEYRNRFMYLSELNEWKSYHVKIKLIILVCLVVLSCFSINSICKRRFNRRIKKFIYF